MVHDPELNPVLGIDLGTTFSAIACWDGRGPRVYQTKTGDDTLQSAIYYDPKAKTFLVGKQAYRRGIINPENIVLGVKRKMDNADEKVKIGEDEFTPIELSSKILNRIYQDVEERYPSGRFKSRGTVVTVPYYFMANQIENTRKAAEMANIECIGILQEPIAASLQYANELSMIRKDTEFSENILVFDLGGGTFDLTLFRLQQTKHKLIFEVISSGGDDRLGGMDFDECLAELILRKANVSLEGVEEKIKRKSRQKLLEAAIDAKITLSATDEAYPAINDVVPGQHIDISLIREEFENAMRDGKTNYLRTIEGIIDGIWTKPGVSIRASDVDRVIRVGGSSQIPCIKALLNEVIGESKVWGNINASLCVVQGAAMYAAYLDDKGVFDREFEFTTVTNHALGVETVGGRFKPIIPVNRKTPCEGKQVFGATEDNMTEIKIDVYQGQSSSVQNNTKIGQIVISDLPPMKKEEMDIVVTFTVSADQELNAEATTKKASTGEIIKRVRTRIQYT